MLTNEKVRSFGKLILHDVPGVDGKGGWGRRILKSETFCFGKDVTTTMMMGVKFVKESKNDFLVGKVLTAASFIFFLSSAV